jgi:uncharacterized protein YdhG (YjbR/CyaY superfamily)
LGRSPRAKECISCGLPDHCAFYPIAVADFARVIYSSTIRASAARGLATQPLDSTVARGRKVKMPKPKTVDAYLAALDSDKRVALQHLRKMIRAAAPRAEECISYGLPAFRLNGRMLVWFGAGANHCAFYPGAVVQAHKADLKSFVTSKGTVRFQPGRPLPTALVRKLMKARIANSAAASARRRIAR